MIVIIGEKAEQLHIAAMVHGTLPSGIGKVRAGILQGADQILALKSPTAAHSHQFAVNPLLIIAKQSDTAGTGQSPDKPVRTASRVR